MIPLRVSVWLIGRYRNFALLIASVHLQDLPAFLIYQPLFYDLPYVQSKLQRKKDDVSFALMKVTKKEGRCFIRLNEIKCTQCKQAMGNTYWVSNG